MSYRDYMAEASRLIARAGEALDERRMQAAIDVIVAALRADRPLLICGNGGSASDAMHIAGELVGRFLIERKAYRVQALATNAAFLTAWANDYEYDTVFSRQVEAYGAGGGVLMGISTSGNSRNVVRALEQARTQKMATIGLTGQGGGAMAGLCDILLDAPSRSTPAIQQVHICFYHYLCAEVERRLQQP